MVNSSAGFTPACFAVLVRISGYYSRSGYSNYQRQPELAINAQAHLEYHTLVLLLVHCRQWLTSCGGANGKQAEAFNDTA